MSGFYIINEKRFPLEVKKYSNVDLLPYYRWEHRVTLGYNFKKIMIFLDNLKSTSYAEEFDGNLKEIEDDALWEGAIRYATEKGFLNVMQPMFKPTNGPVKRFV